MSLKQVITFYANNPVEGISLTSLIFLFSVGIIIYKNLEILPKFNVKPRASKTKIYPCSSISQVIYLDCKK